MLKELDYCTSTLCICFQLLGDMKKQFAELLHDLGFVPSRDPKDPSVNVNSGKNI